MSESPEEKSARDATYKLLGDINQDQLSDDEQNVIWALWDLVDADFNCLTDEDYEALKLIIKRLGRKE